MKRPREVGVRLLKVPEVAALLRTGRKAVYAMIERGQTGLLAVLILAGLGSGRSCGPCRGTTGRNPCIPI